MLTPTPLLATAAAKSCFGTSCGTTDCHAGAVKPDQHRARCRDDGEDELRTDQKAALVDGIRQSPNREREQEHRKATRNPDQRDRQRIGIEARHQPSGRGVVHPGADVDDDGRDPDHRKGSMTKRDPGGGAPLGVRWTGTFVRIGHASCFVGLLSCVQAEALDQKIDELSRRRRLQTSERVIKAASVTGSFRLAYEEME
jgi:hypothetical protein